MDREAGRLPVNEARRRAEDGRAVIRIGEEGAQVAGVDDKPQRQLAGPVAEGAIPLLLEIGARLGRGRRLAGRDSGPLRRCGCEDGRGEVDRPASFLGQEDHRPFRERGDGEERIHPDRRRQDRPVTDVEAVVESGAARTREDPASMVDDPRGRVGGHPAAAQRMDCGEVAAEVVEPPERVLDEHAAMRLSRSPEVLVDRLEDRLGADPGPGDREPLVTVPRRQAERPVSAVMGHDEVDLAPLGGSAVRSQNEALGLPEQARHPLGGALAEVLARQRRRARQDLRHDAPDRARDGTLLDHHALLQLGLVAEIEDPRDAGADRGEDSAWNCR